MPKRNAPTKARQKAIVELMNKGITSPTEIVKMLEQDYGIKTSRQTVHRDIANGVQPITEEIIEEHKDTMLDNIDELLSIAYNKGMKGDTKSMDTYGKLLKVRVEVLKKIVEIQQEMNRADRKIYQVRIGEFPVATGKKENKKDGKKSTDTNADGGTEHSTTD